MRIRIYILLVALAMTVDSHAAVGVRVLMGLSDTSSVQWDGSAAAQGARITKIDPWRFDAEPQPGGETSDGDSFTGPDSWKLATHRIRWFYGGPRQPYVANGVIVWLDGESESSELAVKTAQGNFTVRLGDIPYGKNRKLLDGRVMVDRVPPSLQITNTPDEQDYPAAAADQDGNRLAGVHGIQASPRSRSGSAGLSRAPHELRRPAGASRRRPDPGAQVLGRRMGRADRDHARRRRSVPSGDRRGWHGRAVGLLVGEPRRAISTFGGA